MNTTDERSVDYELTPTRPAEARRHRTLSEAVADYWEHVSEELDAPRASVSGGVLV